MLPVRHCRWFRFRALTARDLPHDASNRRRAQLVPTHEAVISMGQLTKESEKPITEMDPSTMDPALTRPAEPAIPIDQIMGAVNGVRRYVKSRLGRYGLIDDVNDVLQDIRFAAWDGTVRGMYHDVPEIGFPAWVQGIARNLCSDHIRRRLSKRDLPLLDEADSGFRSRADFRLSPVDDQVVDSGWAAEVLRVVRKNVPVETWETAVASLSRDARGSLNPDHESDERKRWAAVTVVRQMAHTVSSAMDIEPWTLAGKFAVRRAAVGCLPTPVLQLIADRIVLTGVRGPVRAEAVAGVAEEVGVSVRYIEVQIGTARRLVRAAMDILDATTGTSDESLTVLQAPVASAVPAYRS